MFRDIRSLVCSLTIAGFLAPACGLAAQAGTAKTASKPYVSPEAAYAGAANEFHFRFIRTMQSPELKNGAASPLAIRFSCLPLALASAGETRAEFVSCFGYNEQELGRGGDARAEPYDSDITHFRRKETSPERLLIGSVWVSKGIADKIDATWGDKVRRHGVVYRIADFSSTDTPQRIGDWVADCSRESVWGGVPSVELARADLTHADVYSLTVFDFNAAWPEGREFSWDKEYPFRVRPTHAPKVGMLRGVAEYGYARDAEYAAVRVPCGQGRYALWLLLPHKDRSVRQLTEEVTATRFSALRAAIKPRRCELLLPPFRIDQAVDVQAVLTKAGMARAFSDRADYTGMLAPAQTITPIRLAKMSQQANVEVDKDKVRATFYTEWMMCLGVVTQPSSNERIVLDHPFLYLVTDERSGVIQFGGWVGDPTLAVRQSQAAADKKPSA